MWNLDTLQYLLLPTLKIGGGYLLARDLAEEKADLARKLHALANPDPP